MNRLIGLTIIAVLASALLLLITPGCDELITESYHDTVTIAGHPIAEFDIMWDSGYTDSGCAPHEVRFVDQSDGPIDEWVWRFGDGDSLVTNDTIDPVHVYDAAGTYAVSLTVINSATEGIDTELKRRFVIVGRSITEFSVEPDSGCAGMEVTCTPTTTGPVDTWLWDFGDGTTSNDSIATHIYDSVGTFTVTLTLKGQDCGDAVLTDSNAVITSVCPEISFAVDSTEGCAPLTLAFYDSTTIDSSEVIQDYLWNFGDGATSAIANPTHLYQNPGDYTVKLRVTSTAGTATDSIIDYISVFGAPQAIPVFESQWEACESSFTQFQVKFGDNSTGKLLSRTWDFGDGTTLTDSVQTSVIHAYPTRGVYAVQLTVVGVCGADTSTSVTPLIENVVLADSLSESTSGFTIAPATGDSSITYLFTDTSAGIILTR